MNSMFDAVATKNARLIFLGQPVHVACRLQEYLANYYAGKPPKSLGKKSAPCLSSSLPTGGISGPGHTILKKSQDSTLSGGGGANSEAADAGFGHSPSLPNRHAKFRDVVEIVEFGERDRVKTGVHFAHEEQLHDDDDDDEDAIGVGQDDDDDDDHSPSVTTPSECSSTTSEDQVLFFAEEDDDNVDKLSTTRSECSTNGTNSPQSSQPDDSVCSPLLGHDGGARSPLIGDAEATASNENVLKNIFTSLTCRAETSTSDESDQHPTMKHVRLMDRVEPVQRQDDYS